jgi:hypothetical protein
MVEHTYRVMVRGRFADLDDAGRERLRAVLDEHGVLTNGFTEQGALSFDRSLDFFSFRIQLRAPVEQNDRAVCDRGLAAAARVVDGLGVDFRDLKASATDMDLIKIRRK